MVSGSMATKWVTCDLSETVDDEDSEDGVEGLAGDVTGVTILGGFLQRWAEHLHRGVQRYSFLLQRQLEQFPVEQVQPLQLDEKFWLSGLFLLDTEGGGDTNVADPVVLSRREQTSESLSESNIQTL